MADNRGMLKRVGIVLTASGGCWELGILLLDWFGRIDALKHLSPNMYEYLASFKLPLLPIGVGITLLSSLRREPSENAVPVVPVSQTNSNTATANPVQNIYINTNPPSDQHSPGRGGAATTFPDSRPEQHLPTREHSGIPKQNTRYLRYEDIGIKVDDHYDGMFWESQSSGTSVRVARFRNSGVPGETVRTFSDVRAHIVYRDATGTELSDVTAARWLGHTADKINLEPGKTESVIVAVPKVGTRVVWWSRRVSTWQGDYFETEEANIPEEATHAEVQLFGLHGLSTEPVTIPLPSSVNR